jgi:signal transduction histidine kinase
VAARALAPIDKITRTALAISAKDLSARLGLPETDDEVGRLASTFDSMLARLDEAFQRERQFTSDASHELRTPLSAMQTIISSTNARKRAPKEYQQALDDLGQEAEHMRKLTEGLLHLARSDASRSTSRFESMDVGLLLSDVVESLRPLADEKGLKLIAHVENEGLTLAGDSDALVRLFVNLLDNAIKYTEHGCVMITAQANDGATVDITISDTGIGIAPEHVPHIFDRFYRVDESRGKDGIGLGLAIVQNITRAHDGTISVESNLGRGTTITVRLPVAAPAR